VTGKSKIRYAASRRRRNTIIVLLVLAAALLIWLDHTSFIQQQAQPGGQTQPGDLGKYHAKSFAVVNVVDGDTLDIDIGDGKSEHTRIRLWGIDTPETRSTKYGVMYFGPEASEFAKQLALGKEVTVYLDRQGRTRGKYGRLLAYVKLPDGSFLNEILLTEGCAYTDLRFDHSFYHKYQSLQATARRNKKGLWEKVTREQLPQWLQREKPTLLLDK